ncbi:MAG: hypothetical protein ACYTG5_20375 [Planctomycetota bacterium]|jgi:hypothetical protein
MQVITNARHSLAGGMILVAMLLQSCWIPGRGPAVPVELTSQAVVPGIEKARYYPNSDNDRFVADTIKSIERLERHLASQGKDEETTPLE